MSDLEQVQETLADIVAEMRDHVVSAKAWKAGIKPGVVMDFADRVEIAARRERDHAIEHATRHAEAVARDNCRDCVHNPNGKNYKGGNEAAMREACQKMLDLLMLRGDGKVRCVLTWDEFNESQKMLRIALSLPPRNCDVGTADEQIARFNEFCDSEWQDSGSANCGNCPLWVSGRIGHDCQIRWAQMPYKAEEGCAK